MFVTEYAADGGSSRVLVHELGVEASGQPTWRELVPDVHGAHQLVGQAGRRVFLYTTTGAPSGRVMAVDLDRPGVPWTEVVAEQAEPVYDDNSPMRHTVGLFGDRIAAMYARNGTVLLRAFDLDGEITLELEHDGLGFTESGLVGRPTEAIVRFDIASIFDRGTTYEVDLHTGARRVLGEPVVPFDASEFVLVRDFYRSFDGTEIPLFLAHRKGLVRDGTNPVLLINWGTAGLIVRPLYMPSYHAWLELGGVLALPAVRGGGEYGEAGTRRARASTSGPRWTTWAHARTGSRPTASRAPTASPCSARAWAAPPQRVRSCVTATHSAPGCFRSRASTCSPSAAGGRRSTATSTSRSTSEPC